MTALALILCGASAATGAAMIFKPAAVHDLTRSLLNKRGMWIATTIRAVLGLGLLAAASDSKAPMLLRLLGLLILIVAILIPILGVDRHCRLLEWWIGRPRPIQLLAGVVAIVFGVGLIYLIL
jgi:uncharacterized membrane protein